MAGIFWPRHGNGELNGMIDPQTALIYTMVLVSASDSDMTDAELGMIGDIVRHLPGHVGPGREAVGALELGPLLRGQLGADRV